MGVREGWVEKRLHKRNRKRESDNKGEHFQALTKSFGIRKLGGQSPRKIIIVQVESLEVSEIPNVSGKLASKAIVGDVHQLEISSIGPGGRKGPRELVVVHLKVNEMFHQTKLRW